MRLTWLVFVDVWLCPRAARGYLFRERLDGTLGAPSLEDYYPVVKRTFAGTGKIVKKVLKLR